MIRVSEPEIGKEELENVTDAVKKGHVSGSVGEYIKRFEGEFSSYIGTGNGVSTNSGTSALHLAVASLGLGKGDEVITSALTNAATTFSIVYNNATPVLVDSEPGTWNLDPGKIEGLITERTKAIMPVHLYGHPADMDAIQKIGKDHDLRIIEDAAEAHGAECRGRRVGSYDIGCFSFYSNKIITTGEGGMVVTDDDGLAERARILRNMSFAPEKRFLHHDIGFNYRMTNLAAAIGCAQMGRIDGFIKRKREIAKAYNDLLGDVKGIELPPEKKWARSVYWMYSIVVDGFKASRDMVMEGLKKQGIESRAFFIPMNMQPAFRSMGLFEGTSCPVAERLSETGMYLPSGTGLTDEDIHAVADAVKAMG